jgi:hypothetical protein
MADEDQTGHSWTPSLAYGDPKLDLEEQLERAAYDLLRGLVAEGELITASSHGPVTLAIRAGRCMAKQPDSRTRAQALAEWLLDEDEVEDLLIDDDSLAERIAAVFPDDDPDAPGDADALDDDDDDSFDEA